MKKNNSLNNILKKHIITNLVIDIMNKDLLCKFKVINCRELKQLITYHINKSSLTLGEYMAKDKHYNKNNNDRLLMTKNLKFNLLTNNKINMLLYLKNIQEI